ncbi:DUF4350 domain-containing protein [Christiangramia sabulilitoris]|uniref:DUF4350 domain-containing protein n=1 Tax=Christiangramia sabulilitoris TaxID=2583991 RepID=A0A550I6X6_9FLAO|nr:DUF4350 domain-containing protein [Christiangramia sabulilitoris]TRO66727.1 DUF4350 domain-containing protein [Christiangramia sabulilitoris]
MNKTYKTAFALFLLLVISLAWLESTEPEPINWTPSFTAKDKIPLGAFVFYESWKETQAIKNLRIPPYEYLNSSPDSGTYFFLNDYVDFDRNELRDLLQWVSDGNRIFISAYNFGTPLSDTLNFETASYISSDGFKTRPGLNLVNKDLKLKKARVFDHDLPAVYFKKIDTTKSVVLGTAAFEEKELEAKINFIKTDFGKGEIFLHTTPQAFSNYFLLDGTNYSYTEALLAYLRGNQILWDAYYKSGKSFFSSPLYILLNNRPLKWAYYFIIISGILFVLFEGKRKQRSIPVVDPPANKSFEFTETISQLYLEQKKFHELGLKKISLFLEFIRKQYRIDTSVINEKFYKDLAVKSEHSIEETKKLFEQIHNFREKNENSKEDFFRLAKHINTFKNKNGKSGHQS